MSNVALTAGVYVIEVYDFDLSGTNTAPHCMSVSITGA
jgi:arginine deiminase